ncbi:hypothetical protein CR492_14270 [Methylocella silvestris]|uniref:Uncharacterized protein n=1 Tax=Methylocella silvestris TaxID=199596 RepID=A0A2J7TEZ6_METSI|nr:hypothetical protein CR492_14270 [Methylocella silvestris]
MTRREGGKRARAACAALLARGDCVPQSEPGQCAGIVFYKQGAPNARALAPEDARYVETRNPVKKR